MSGPGARANNALMWEVRAAEGQQEQLLTWIGDNVVPLLSHQAGCRNVDVYRSDEQRVVVIAHFDGAPAELPEPPGELVARPVHQWPFERVRSIDLPAGER